MTKKYTVSLDIEEITLDQNGKEIFRDKEADVPPLYIGSFKELNTAIAEIEAIYNDRNGTPKTNYREVTLINHLHFPRLHQWMNENELVGIRNEDSGVIEAYAHKSSAEAIVRCLNGHRS